MSTRLPAPERRESIIAAASSLFADKGFHGVSINDIARRVDVSPAILYRHFASKQELYDTVLTELAGERETYEEAIATGGNSFESVLAGMTRIFVDSVADNPDLLRIEMQSLLDGNEASRSFFENRWKSISDFIELSLDQRLPQKMVNRQTTIVTASVMFQGMMREALVQKLLKPHGHAGDIDLRALSDEMVLLFLHAVGINKPQLSRKAVIKT